MAARIPYATILDAIGARIERAGAVDVLVNELDGGFLVSYMTPAGQRVETIDAAELEQWLKEAASHKGRPAPPGPRIRLRAVGRYLDQRRAAAVIVQERVDGYSLEFTGLPPGDDLAHLDRLHESVSETQVAALSK